MALPLKVRVNTTVSIPYDGTHSHMYRVDEVYLVGGDYMPASLAAFLLATTGYFSPAGDSETVSPIVYDN